MLCCAVLVGRKEGKEGRKALSYLDFFGRGGGLGGWEERRDIYLWRIGS